MTKNDIFNIWAPPEAVWSPWAKPVLFAQMSGLGTEALAQPQRSPEVDWAVDSLRATALVVDLPGAAGVTLALALAAKGYRPVPLYNAAPEPLGNPATVNVRPTMLALAAGIAALRAAQLPFDAPPVFLLDANRNDSAVIPQPGVFDNRSISLPTDFPSANFLLSHGIRQVILARESGTTPQADLAHTVLRWQEARIPILAKALDSPDAPQVITVHRPHAFRLLWYNLLAKAGLRRSPLGGFGGRLPMPSSG